MRAPRPPAAAAIAAALVALALAAVAPDAWGFCRSTTCDDVDDCGEPIPEACKPLSWARPCIGFAIQEGASRELDYAQARGAMSGAFAAWTQADCGGGAAPGIVAYDLGQVTCDRVEYNSRAGNVNVLAFRDQEWPHLDGQHNLALTTVMFEPDTGILYNADIELNTAGYDFSDGGQYDLLSVLTHEVGHFLGLSHSPITDATMFFAYTDYATDFRTLERDDTAAICAAYPPAAIDPLRCNPIPRHGFASACGADQVGGCSVMQREGAPQGEAARAGPVAALAAALAAAWLRRLRARSAPRAP